MTIPITNKKEQLSKFRADMLNKSLTMFEWKNLPDTLPAVEIEKQLQTNGYTIIGKVQGNVLVGIDVILKNLHEGFPFPLL